METFRQFLGTANVKEPPFFDNDGNITIQDGDTIRWNNEAGESLAGQVDSLDIENKTATVKLYSGEMEELQLT